MESLLALRNEDGDDWGKPIIEARSLYINYYKNVNGFDIASLPILRKILPEKYLRERSAKKLDSQNNILKKGRTNLEKAINTVGQKIIKMNNWQNSNDDSIIKFVDENKSLEPLYSNITNDKKTMQKAYDLVVKEKDVKSKAEIRKGLRETNAKLQEIFYLYNKNNKDIRYFDRENDKFEEFRQGLQKFYYTAKTLDDGLVRVMTHTDRLINIFGDLHLKLRVIADYTNQGMELWDYVTKYFDELRTIYGNLNSSGRDIEGLTDNCRVIDPFGNKFTSSSLNLANKIILEGDQNGKK